MVRYFGGLQIQKSRQTDDNLCRQHHPQLIPNDPVDLGKLILGIDATLPFAALTALSRCHQVSSL